MRRVVLTGIVPAAVCLLLAAAGAGRLMSVKHKKSYIRARPFPLGKRIKEVNYGDRVQVLGQYSSWYKVRAGGGTDGWLLKKVLTPKRIVFKASAADVRTGASADEVELAGKGFDKRVEGEYRKRNPSVAQYFPWVERMLAIDVPPQRMKAFLNEGRLRAQEGGAQ
jgi:uncharacterized protein YgiM (DUF1202 family)